MSKEGGREILSEELTREIRDRIEKGLEDLRKRFEELSKRRKELLEDKALIAIGVAFLVGFALGAILSRSKE